MDRILLILEPFCSEHMERISNAVSGTLNIRQIGYDNKEALREALKEAEVVIGQPPLSMLQDRDNNCPNLKLVQMTWAGTDIYTKSDLPFPKEYISLANASGTYGMIISQYVIGMILTLMLNFKAYHNQQQKMIWEKRGPIKSLDGASVLIYGAGDIGTAVAKRLSGFDAKCIGVCRDTSKEREYFKELCTLEESDRYLKEADVVVGCIPNIYETEGFLNEERLNLMKKGSILVNVGRGNFIDCMALDRELNSGHLWGAALDVTNPEPLPKNHPLWHNDRCMITPHTSGTAFSHLDATEELLCNIICDNLSRYCNEKDIINRIY